VLTLCNSKTCRLADKKTYKRLVDRKLKLIGG